jgi:predicted lysophospholipase L1 biosynthesis ABC-type transport system permease subunit
MAENLKVGLGDELSFEIQGVPMATRVASIREVDWQRVQPNFFVVFPEGVLEARRNSLPWSPAPTPTRRPPGSSAPSSRASPTFR